MIRARSPNTIKTGIRKIIPIVSLSAFTFSVLKRIQLVIQALFIEKFLMRT